MKNMIRKLKKTFKWMKFISRNIDEIIPVYVDNESNGLKLHLGSGPFNLQGWVNIDARQYKHIHICKEDFDLKEFVDSSVSEIYMCHVIEHFSFAESKCLLINLKKKLAKNGVLRISVPDFDKIVNIYNKNKSDLNVIKGALMGGQGYEYNFHKSVYNYKSIKNLLTDCGYNYIKEWSTKEDFGVSLGDWSDKTIKSETGNFEISLNVKALKMTEE
jgi:predicted SAM-dependent methyltransferase